MTVESHATTLRQEHHSEAEPCQHVASERNREGLRDLLLGPAQLYEALRAECDRPQPEAV